MLPSCVRAGTNRNRFSPTLNGEYSKPVVRYRAGPAVPSGVHGTAWEHGEVEEATRWYCPVWTVCHQDPAVGAALTEKMHLDLSQLTNL